MRESPESLEQRIAGLRSAVRRALAGGDRTAARALRAELRAAEDSWERAVLGGGDPKPVLLPVREQVHHALSLLGVPAAPKLIVAVHDAFFSGELASSRLTSLRRDEERSFRSAPYSRPYYLCAALTADLLAPARGLLVISTWPLPTRIVGPYSPRADFLTSAIRVAEHTLRTGAGGDAVRPLLWRFAANIPGAAGDHPHDADPRRLLTAATAELDVHTGKDTEQRRQAADRARRQLGDVEQLFGARLAAAARAQNGRLP
jgi:hypothetical protein